MKNLILIIIVLAFAAGCAVEDATPSVPVDDDFHVEGATLVKQGTLVGIGHTARGVASIYEVEGKFTVLLDPYESQNGPDLKIYLSKDAAATAYLRLGNLKSTVGKQSYAVPAGTLVSEYHFVHVWCEKYTVVFAQAELEE
jgi:Electron transfer DM13